LKNKFATGVNF